MVFGSVATQNSQLSHTLFSMGEASTYCKLSRVRRSCSVRPETASHDADAVRASAPQAAKVAAAPRVLHRPRRSKKRRREMEGMDSGIAATDE